MAIRTVLGRVEDEDRIRGWIGLPLRACLEEIEPDRVDEMFAVYVAWNEANAPRLARPVPGVAGLLADLHHAGARVAVATSKRAGSAQLVIGLTGLAELLPVVVTMEDTLVHKPDPAPLRAAVLRAGGVPTEAVYVGDAVVDIEAARAGDLSSVGVLWGASTRAELESAGADVVVDTVPSLRQLLLPGGVGSPESRSVTTTLRSHEGPVERSQPHRSHSSQDRPAE